jgi:SpoIIAA-like
MQKRQVTRRAESAIVVGRRRGRTAMIDVELLPNQGILIITPQGALSADDFHKVAAVADPYIAEKGQLTGLMIRAPSFPGWDSFASLIEHLKFLRDHHRKIARVAAVTDSGFIKVARAVAQHLAQPDIRQFPRDQEIRALAWLETGK